MAKKKLTIAEIRILMQNENMSAAARAVGLTPQAIRKIRDGGDLVHERTFIPLQAYFEKLGGGKS